MKVEELINIEPINPYPIPVFDELTLEQLRQSHSKEIYHSFLANYLEIKYGLAPQQEYYHCFLVKL